MGTFIIWTVFILLESKVSLKMMKICEEIMNIVVKTSLKKMILEFNHGKKSMEVLFNIYANT